jgi:hypothetical protein
MKDSEPERPHVTADGLIGAWESFKGDGLHGWIYRVLVFSRDGGRLILETWRPTTKGKNLGKLRLDNIVGVNCFPNGRGWRLSLEKGPCNLAAYDIWPGDGETFILTIPNTTAGATHFRRTVLPRRAEVGD